MKIYICSGWFSPDQESRLNEMLTICKQLKLNIYSPRDDFLYEPGKTNPQEVFEENLKQINTSNMLLVSTAGKDMGTLWECGYAFANNIPLVFYFPLNVKFNLMLSQSAEAVLRSLSELEDYLKLYKETETVYYIPYKGDIE